MCTDCDTENKYTADEWMSDRANLIVAWEKAQEQMREEAQASVIRPTLEQLMRQMTAQMTMVQLQSIIRSGGVPDPIEMEAITATHLMEAYYAGWEMGKANRECLSVPWADATEELEGKRG